jgi:hypothetical protein
MDQFMKREKCIPQYNGLTIDFAMALAGVAVLLENKNLVFLGTSTEKGYDPVPFATGTCGLQIG